MSLIRLTKEKIKERSLFSLIKYIFMTPIVMLMKILPYSPLRIFIIKLLGTKVDYSSILYSVEFINTDIGTFRNLRIGKYSHINANVMIDLRGKVEIGDYVTIAPRAMIFSHQGVIPQSQMVKYYPEKVANVIIGNGAYIGAGAIILSGVTIEEMAVVGAGSVVTKNVPAFTIVAGNPAKKIKKLEK